MGRNLFLFLYMGTYLKAFESTDDFIPYESSLNYVEPYLAAAYNSRTVRYNKFKPSYNKIITYDNTTKEYHTYHECEYIENSSNAYIDTNIKNGANSFSIDASISITTLTNGYIFGSRGSSSTHYWQLLRILNTANLSTSVHMTTVTKDDYTLQTNKKYHLSGTLKNLTVQYQDTETRIEDEVEIEEIVDKSFTITNSGTFVSNGNNIAIFNIIYSPTDANGFKGKIYYFKIYNSSGTLVRDYIPARDELTGKYGLLDKVNNVFYTSPNGIPFTGAEILTDANGIQYRQKNYVNVNSTKYISTGIAPDAQDSWEAKYYFNSGRNYAWGAWTGGGTTFNNAYGINASGSTIYFNYADTQTSYNVSYDNKIFVLKANKNIFYVNGNIIGQVTETTGETASRNFLIGNYNGSSYAGSGKIYYFKYWQHDVLVRDYIPVQRISDNVYGLFDKVRKVFQTSAGSAAFTGG